jgi:hypothetical protein
MNETQLRPPGVIQNRPARSEMTKRIEQAKTLNSESTALSNRKAQTTYHLAKALDEIQEGQYAELATGRSFRAFVESLRDENGNPRNWAWARNLLQQLRKIRTHKYLVLILEKQSTGNEHGFVSINSGYWAARLAEEANWYQQVAAQMRDAGIPKEDWEQEKQARLVGMFIEWGCKSVRDIKEKISEVKNDRADVETPANWTYHGGRVDPDVKSRYDAVLERLTKLTRGQSDIVTLSYVQEIETIAEGVGDILDAFDATINGNSQPLQGILEQIAGESDE